MGRGILRFGFVLFAAGLGVAACAGASGDGASDDTSDDALRRRYQTQGRNTWWDPTNQTLPSFHQALTWVKAVAEGMSVPALFWQNPVGNMALPNTTNQYKDNRVDYFFAHPNELVAAHVVGAAFGSGASGQTTPETANGNFVAKANAYYPAGGTRVCP